MYTNGVKVRNFGDKMVKAVYPGTFDPFSNGHLDIVKRASQIFDEVHILVSCNIKKHPTFTAEERVNLIKMVVKDMPNVKVISSNALVVQYAKENEIKVIIRGLRNYQDYESEFSLAQFNKDIEPNIETLLMMPSAKNQFISSSAIKEFVIYNIDISPYVPKEIVPYVTKKFKSNNTKTLL